MCSIDKNLSKHGWHGGNGIKRGPWWKGWEALQKDSRPWKLGTWNQTKLNFDDYFVTSDELLNLFVSRFLIGKVERIMTVRVVAVTIHRDKAGQ